MSAEAILGPMGAGKTTALLRKLKIQADPPNCAKVAYIVSVKDTRGEKYSTHNNQLAKEQPGIDFFKVEHLGQFDPTGYEYIGIDEGHFFDDLNETVRHWVLNLDKDIIVSALNGDSEIQNFGQTHLLLPLFTPPGGITVLPSTCSQCRREGKKSRESAAGFTAALKKKEGQVAIGGMESYEPVCLKHYGLPVDRTADSNRLSILI